MKISVALANAMLQGSSLKEQLDGGFIYLFAGAVPADADAALDMVSTHTLLAKIAADTVPADAGVVGLNFDTAAVNAAIAKAPAETWAAKINFTGKDAAQAGVSSLQATFFRHCAAADNGQAIGTTSTPRIQGTIATAGADMVLGNVMLFDNGANTTGLGSYEVRLPTA